MNADDIRKWNRMIEFIEKHNPDIDEDKLKRELNSFEFEFKSEERQII